LKFCDSEDSLEKELNDFAVKNKEGLGLVSLDVPLISNLDVWINIALIRQYHQNLPPEEAEKEVVRYLQRYHLEKIAHRRSSALTDEERFCVMLLRAAMVADAIIVIDRPFKILPELQNSQFIFDSIRVIDDLYRESHIFDYIWFKGRYRIIDAT
jgi:ABC-type lipopolysaccharide export system ATPase subunit